MKAKLFDAFGPGDTRPRFSGNGNVMANGFLSFASLAHVPLGSLSSRLRRRHLLLPVILLVHLLILMALTFFGPSIAPRVPPIGSPLSIFDVNVTETKVSRPKPPPPPEVADIVVPEPIVELELELPAPPTKPLFDAAAAARAGFGTTCDLAGTLGRAFEENPILRHELSRIGRDSRSVANAIMFWDGDWVEMPGRAPADALHTLRRGIVEGVQAAAPECLSEDVAGPRFISVRETNSTMTLVLGSGTWRWQQILEENPEGIGTSTAAEQ